MDDSISKCPRCPDGGSVKPVAKKISDSSVFSHQPGQASKGELFQCGTCGWTMVRTMPQDKQQPGQ
jgi:hypothetical protein